MPEQLYQHRDEPAHQHVRPVAGGDRDGDAAANWSSSSAAERVAYATSADVSGDKSRVVGYAGMLIGT